MDPDRTAKPHSQPKQAGEMSSGGSDAEWGTYFLGPYRIVDEIGVGGMATVELGRMDGAGGFQKWVAIKRIHPHLTEDQQFINMFLDEARIAASISHPNVAQVFDLGKDQNTYWIAMEYLHGEPLREIMRINEEKNTAVEPELAARMIADAAEGLHAAHELRGKDGRPLNLVHRDVTPHNLFVTYDGVMKVVDFGIAKVAGSLSNTHAGTIKGKVAYMSPEQVRGKPIDRRTDVFALGVVLWEMTTGRRLFRVESDLGTLSRVEACVVPPPSAFDEDFPEQLEAVLLKALERESRDRYQTAREFSRALQKYLMSSHAFVGPEEVSVYVTDLCRDRLQKREDHLRWAADVTQTISIRKALTAEEPGDLLDLSKLPSESSDSEAAEYDTLRDQSAPTADGVLFPLGAEKTPDSDPQNDRLACTMRESPLALSEGRKGRDIVVSDTEAIALIERFHKHEAKVVVPIIGENEDDEDDVETLIANAPELKASIDSALGQGWFKIAQDQPIDSESDVDSLSLETSRYLRSEVGRHLSLDDLEREHSLNESGASQPIELHESDGAWPPTTDNSDESWKQKPRQLPVFDANSLPTADTFLLDGAKSRVSPILIFAAAMCAGLLAAGLIAIWWVRSHPEPTTPSLFTANVSSPINSAPPPASTPASTPALSAPPSMMTVGPAKSMARGSAEEKPTSAPRHTKNDAGYLSENFPAFPRDAEDRLTAARPGFLTIRCHPPCDQIIAGEQTFTGSVNNAPMPPGSYRVRCIRGNVTNVLTIIVVSDELAARQIKMD